MNIETILYRLFSKINRFLPKRNVILFYSTVDFNDNPFYLYKKAIELGVCEEYECIWIVNSMEGKRRVETFGGHAIYRGDKRKLLRVISSAKYFVSANGPPLWKSSNQIAIELWHGIPLKTIGNLFPTVDYFISTSKFSSLIFSFSLGIKVSKFIPLGQPRCDALFMPSQKAMENLSQILGADVTEYTKTIMYLPTFRDYDSKATSRISLELINNSKFRDFLSQNNVLFIVKPHPHDEKLFEKYESDHIKIIKNEELLSRFLTLYDILPAVDILVTDYSSVYFDYLLLNRPIVFYIPDLEKYRETRGFLLEPYEKWTPGDKARTLEELVVALEEAINNPRKWERERLWLRDVMFKYQDGKASERIIKYFWGDV